MNTPEYFARVKQLYHKKLKSLSNEKDSVDKEIIELTHEYKMGNGGFGMSINLEQDEIDTILGLLNRKIEKVEQKEIDEAQVAYLKELKSIKANIEAQIS